MDDLPDLVANRYSEGEIQAFLWFLFGCLILVIVAYVIAAFIRASTESPFQFLVRPIKKTRLRRVSEDELKRPFTAGTRKSIRSVVWGFIKQVWPRRQKKSRRPKKISKTEYPRCINQSFPEEKRADDDRS